MGVFDNPSPIGAEQISTTGALNQSPQRQLSHSQRILELQQRVQNLEKNLEEVIVVVKRLVESHGAEELQR